MRPYFYGALAGLAVLTITYLAYHVGYRDGTMNELLHLTMPMS